MTGGLDSIIRLHRWRLEERRRNLAQLEGLRAEFECRGRELEAEIHHEQKLAVNGDAHFSYGAYARAAIERRQTIAGSIRDVDLEVAKARDEVAEAFREVKKFEIARDRERQRQRMALQSREQAVIDDIGLEMHRRRKPK